MPLTAEEQQELDALLAEGNAAKAKAENPETKSPLEEHMDEIDPEGAMDQPSRVEMPASEQDSKPGFLERLRASMGGAKTPLSAQGEVAKAALPEVPIGSQDRVMVDALTRGWADKGVASITGSTVEEQRAKTRAATEDAGDSAGQFRFAGEIAPYFLLGAGAGGLIRAGVAGAAMGVGDSIATTAGHEDRLSDGEEMMIAGLTGMGGGVLGNIAGKVVGGLWSQATHGKEALPGYVMRAMTRQAKLTDDAGKAMDSSKLVISKAYLKKMSDSIEKTMLKEGVRPEGTKNAWAALDRLKAGINSGEDLTIRQVNEVRRGIQEIKAKSYEQRYIRTMGKKMNELIENLPNVKGAVKSGDAKQGVEGWTTMNKHFQDQLKLNKMGEKLALARARATSGKVTFDRAMQDEFGKWTQSKSGIREFDDLFTKEEQKLLMPLTKGTATTQTINKIDRIFAKGWFGNLLRVSRASLAHMPAKVQAEQQFGKAFGQLPGGTTPIGVQGLPARAAGSAAIVEGNEMNKDRAR